MYIENKTIEETGLEIGKTYWLYVVNALASTYRSEITVKDIQEHESYAQYKNILSITFREKGKRKDTEIYLKKSMLFLETLIALEIDTDYNAFSMNACINFVTNAPEKLRPFILKNNKYKFSNLGILTYGTPNSHNLKILFPDKADMNHAVIRKIAETK